MRRGAGWLVLGMSAAGYPLVDLMLRRGGRTGAVIAESVCVGLAVRDLVLVAGGAPRRLARIPADLLVLELAAATLAGTVGLRPVLARQSAGAALPARAAAVQRAAGGALFLLHTIRFRIYLSPGHGRPRPRDLDTVT
jgi:hypothetical protein